MFVPAKPHRRDGVALVIVLGLLAVMILFAISFSISSRTDRMATRSYADVVKARQLVHTAFNKVLAEHITADMQDVVYPGEEAFSQADPNGVKLLGDQSMTSAAVFLPMSVRSEAFAADPVRWLELRSQDNRVLGEYAYLVVNCSGLLDANSIGGRESETNPRQRGTNPSEIRFHPDILPEVFTGGANGLRSYRNGFGRFESVPELYYIGSTTEFEGTLGTRPLQQITADYMADNLHVFSRVPYGFANEDLSANTNLIADISGDPAGWDVGAIEAAIADIDGAPIPDVPAFVRVMQDYASEGYELAGANDAEKFERISSKRVPMINEVIVSNTLQYVAATTSVLHTVYITVETWYPFEQTGPEEFRVEIGTGAAAASLGVTIQPPSPPALAGLTGPHLPTTGFTAPGNFSPAAGSYALHTFSFSKSVGVPGVPTVPIRFRADVALTEPIVVRYGITGGPIVDQVNVGFANRVLASGAVPLAGGGVAAVDSQSASVNDPRINWSPTLHFTTVAPTPAARNLNVAGPADELGLMYARQEPIESVGEVGYLLFDSTKPWTTIRLIGGSSTPAGYPVQAAKVLDRLSVLPASDYPRRGLVNPNTRQTNALAAAFWTMPLERYEGDTITRLDDTADARAIASHLQSRVKSQGTITNMSDLVNRLDQSGVDPVLGTSADKFKRESLVRNSFGLLSPRHNLFTIFVAARTFVEGYTYNPGDAEATKSQNVASEQRAVAVVWRDPYTITDGAGNTTHQSWIQYFHWFSGAFGD